MFARSRVVVVALVVAALTAACGSAPAVEAPMPVPTLAAADVDVVKGARVFFHHMSVGDNVLAGLARVAPSLTPVKVDPTQGKVPGTGPAFLHAMLGGNGSPFGKFEAFKAALTTTGFEQPPDVVLMKLCFVDIDAGTDVAALIKGYEGAVAAAKQALPGTQVVHVTAPMLPKDTGLKEFIKGTLGVKDGNAQGNMKRAAFNTAVRTRFGTDVVFDLAAVEATRPDGQPERFTRDGVPYESLYPGYTDDGAHLAGAGQDRAAVALVQALAKAVRQRPAASP
jgi:hypothetical protein